MLLTAENICYKYKSKRNTPWILKDVSLDIKSGERVGVVGPSGYGKSTLAKIMAGYIKADSGNILLDGKPLPSKCFSPVQMIYQHPEFAVNPRLRVGDSLREAWNPDDALLEKMGIEKDWLKRWPQELSGGELQRFCIARVLCQETKFLVCDEITTMLDVITQAQIWQLLLEIAEERKLGMMIITHNKHLASKVCTRIVQLPEINKI